jgi:hypothetical protein
MFIDAVQYHVPPKDRFRINMIRKIVIQRTTYRLVVKWRQTRLAGCSTITGHNVHIHSSGRERMELD